MDFTYSELDYCWQGTATPAFLGYPVNFELMGEQPPDEAQKIKCKHFLDNVGSEILTVLDYCAWNFCNNYGNDWLDDKTRTGLTGMAKESYRETYKLLTVGIPRTEDRQDFIYGFTLRVDFIEDFELEVVVKNLKGDVEVFYYHKACCVLLDWDTNVAEKSSVFGYANFIDGNFIG